MSAVTPKVWTDAWSSFAYLESPCDGRVTLDTPAWVAWLESAAAVSFAYPVFDPARGYMVGVMTVRKECRRRGGAYWVAYRRQAGRLRKVYLGVSAAITRDCLERTACSFLQPHTSLPALVGDDTSGPCNSHR